jgi:hypothetical protein
MSRRAVSHVCHAEVSGSVDQAIRLKQSLESRVLCLDGVNLGDCERISTLKIAAMRWFLLTGVCFAQGGGGVFRESNVFRLARPSQLVEDRDRLFKGRV